MAIIVMGVSGCGKTSVGEHLSGLLKRPFVDGDDLHTEEAKKQMKQGIPLTDTQRIPWLALLGEYIHSTPQLIVACSALKRSYRRQLTGNNKIFFVELDIDFSVASFRISHRADHFFPEHLLSTQYDTLEPLSTSEIGMKVEASQSIDSICNTIIDTLSSIAYPY